VPDDLTSALDQIRELFGRRNVLLDRMNAAPGLSEEFDAAQDELAAVQDELAARTPLLLAALDEVLRLTAPPAPLDVLFHDSLVGPEISKETVREAIAAELAREQPGR